MAYINGNGQIRVGVRGAIVNSPVQSTTTISASLLQSIYGVWNGDVITNELGTLLYGVWNGEYSGTASLTQSLYGAWNGEISASDSVGTNHGTLMNGCTFSTGKIGQAFSFDGVNDYIKLANNSLNYTNSNSFSTSIWVYASRTNVHQSLIASYTFNGSQGYGWFVRLSPGTDPTNNSYVEFGTDNQPGTGNPIFLKSTTLINKNSWNLITVTRNGSSGTERLYINGVLSGNRTLTTNYLFNSSITFYPTIGSNQWSPTNIDTYFQGMLDSVNIWNRELSANEVSMLYNGSNGTQYSSGNFGLTQSSLDSFGTYHGTISNTSFTTGKLGSSAFNFTGGNINMGTSAANFGTNPFTISLWFYPNAGNNLQMLVAKGFTGGTDKGFYINTDNRYNSNQNGISFGVSVGGGSYRTIVTTSAFPYTTAAWNHLLVTRSGNTTSIYLNGVLTSTTNSQVAGTGNVSGDISNTSANMLLGQYGTGGLNFSGRMDGLTIWNRVVSLDEITQLYNSGTGTQYPFTGTFSSAGNQLGMDNGTLMNGCYLSTGKIGQSFTFDGVNDYVSLPDNSFNFTGDFSVSAWIYVSNLTGEKFIISNVNGNAIGLNFGWCFGLYDNKLSFGSYGNTVYSAWIGVDTLLVNTWYHVLVTKKNSQKPKFYINGNLSTCSLHPNCTGIDSTNPIYSSVTYPNIKSSIGTYRYNNGSSLYAYWNGKIDALNVYQKELTQDEVTELYNSGNGKQVTTTPIVQTGLVLNLDASRTSSYPNSGTTWTDISGNGNNGTLVNGPIFGTANGGVITLDGVNDYVDFGNNTLLYNAYNAQFTQEFSIRLNSNASSFKTIFRVDDWSRISLVISSSQISFKIGYDNGSTQSDALTLNYQFNYNQWYIITTVWNKLNTQKIYINGILVGERIPTLSTYAGITGTSGGVNIGRGHSEPYSNYLNFDISTFKHYNRVLTDSEILQNFNATKSRFGL